MGNFYDSYTACSVGDAGLHSCGILFLTLFFRQGIAEEERVSLVGVFFFSCRLGLCFITSFLKKL